ncbi:MAG: SurA N-terminal domain-containing protein [Actinomycetota bacterium]|nr:SurA N-terminal domain-containing protein [Actinomycetota bacterium]
MTGRQLALAAAVLALAVSACEPREVGAAAVVGDERISVTELQGDVEAYIASLPAGQRAGVATGDLQREILQLHIRRELLERLTAAHGVTVSEADIDRALGSRQQVDSAVAREAGYVGLAAGRLIDELGDEGFRAALSELVDETGVEMNPRYGEWVEDSLRSGTGSLSTPAQRSDDDAVAPVGR